MDHGEHRGHREHREKQERSKKGNEKHFFFFFVSLCSLCPLCSLCLSTAQAADAPRDHTRLQSYLDDKGRERPVATPKEWARRRAQVLDGMQEAMGRLPDRSNLPPLDVKVSAEEKFEGYRRLTLSFLSEGTDRVPADLYLPTSASNGKRPAMLALHQTSTRGRR